MSSKRKRKKKVASGPYVTWLLLLNSSFTLKMHPLRGSPIKLVKCATLVLFIWQVAMPLPSEAPARPRHDVTITREMWFSVSIFFFSNCLISTFFGVINTCSSSSQVFGSNKVVSSHSPSSIPLACKLNINKVSVN